MEKFINAELKKYPAKRALKTTDKPSKGSTKMLQDEKSRPDSLLVF